MENNNKKEIKAFIISNWKNIKDNDAVKNALFGAFCMGRINKEKRAEMVKDIVAECEGEKKEEKLPDDVKVFGKKDTKNEFEF